MTSPGTYAGAAAASWAGAEEADAANTARTSGIVAVSFRIGWSCMPASTKTGAEPVNYFKHDRWVKVPASPAPPIPCSILAL